MITAALIGNPNSGKTTVFNTLTGSIQKTGNWPGVTVERKQGYIRNTTKDKILVVDLPGIYSLSPYSPEEIVSRDYLIGTSDDRPDVAINIIDASNLERGLYLLSQVADLGIPMVVVLNMMDVAEKSNMTIDAQALSRELGCEVVETTANKSVGTERIAEAVQKAYDGKKGPALIDYGADVEECVSKVSDAIAKDVRDGLVRWAALKLIERDEMVMNDLDKVTVDEAMVPVAEMEKKLGNDGTQIIATARYDASRTIKDACLTKAKGAVSGNRISDKIDNILINRILGIPIFIAVMYVVYYISVQTIGTMGNDFINDGFMGWVDHNVGRWMIVNDVDPQLRGLVVTGIIGGVGAVIGFLPQIIVLFLLLSILEECGYMARVAYVLDRVFCHFGLSGKTVVPAVIGIGCGVPAIMGTRTIEDPMNRNIAVMSTTFMPCSAKLPILTVIISAFFGGSAALTLGLYLLGIVMILVSGLILKKFSGFVGKPAPFVMELPVYHVPTVRNVLTSIVEKSWAFVRKAGTLILLSAVIIWFLSSYTWSFEYLGSSTTTGSMLADIGNAVTWIFLPAGFGQVWELTVGSITGLMAKENLLATVAILFDAAVDGDDIITADALVQVLGPNGAGLAMAFLIFNLLCAPCFAAIGAMHRELGTWKKTGLAVLYQCVLAYMVATIFYQFWYLGWGTGSFDYCLILAVAFIVILGYFIVAKDPVGSIKRRAVKA